MNDRKTGLKTRKAALELIDGALSRRGGLDQAVAAMSGLEERDRAFARATAMTVLRRRGQIDRILAERIQKPPPEAVLVLIRLGLAQALFMEVADHAAVATTLELAGADKAARPYKGLINGVLRGVLRDRPQLRDEDLVPSWLFARWSAAFGRESATSTAAMMACDPPTDLSLKSPEGATALAEALEGEVLNGGVRTSRRGDVTAWPGFEAGDWWVQDAAAALPGRLLKTGPGQTVLDLCAAPGGKTLQLAAGGATVTALDRSPARLKRLHQNLARTGLNAEVIAEPAETWADERQFDAVLLDAPCTATGTFRRQPEVLWLAHPPEIAKLAGVQRRLLDAAAKRVKPGGKLVYCVCSLEPEEGEAQARDFLKRHGDFARSPVQPGEAGEPAGAVTADGDLRLLPGLIEGGMDGFFAARFVRQA